MEERSGVRAMPVADLLLGMRGMLPKDGMQTLTAKKKPRTTMQTLTTEKPLRPMTLAELRAEIQALQPNSKRGTQTMSTRKKIWNSSVKIDNKKKICTADGQMKHNSVRKVLNFQSKPKPVSNSRNTMYHTSETPKFTKPELKQKKSLYVQANTNVNVSGIYSIPQTPAETSQFVRKKTTVANNKNYCRDKENNPRNANLNEVLKPPMPVIPKIVVETPTNMSWKSGSDLSFLQKEKEILESEESVKQISEEHTLENLAEISPPMSTPFKEYRSVQEYFNNSSEMESSALYEDNTIMCFDKPSNCKENEEEEESSMVKLRDYFIKAVVIHSKKELKENTGLDEILQMKKETEDSISMMTCLMETQRKTLQHLDRLIQSIRDGRTIFESNEKEKTLVEVCGDIIEFVDDKVLSPKKSPIIGRPCSVVKSPLRSPSYKIPRKSIGLKKNILCKSMPSISSALQTPVKNFNGEALNMYMAMKRQMNFLSTPKVNRDLQVPDTPAVTSRNLQNQLDKLYRK